MDNGECYQYQYCELKELDESYYVLHEQCNNGVNSFIMLNWKYPNYTIQYNKSE